MPTDSHVKNLQTKKYIKQEKFSLFLPKKLWKSKKYSDTTYNSRTLNKFKMFKVKNGENEIRFNEINTIIQLLIDIKTLSRLKRLNF